LTNKRVPLGLIVAGLFVVLATIGIVNGLWSKNLVVHGVVTTGDLNVDWTFNTQGHDDGALDPVPHSTRSFLAPTCGKMWAT